jgi:acyl carrier protein
VGKSRSHKLKNDWGIQRIVTPRVSLKVVNKYKSKLFGRCRIMEVESKIRDFVARNLLFSEEGFLYEDDASFLQQGIIDSLGVLELVTFAGKEFGLQVEPADVTPENFDSVNQMAAFIRSKQTLTPETHCVGS